MVIVPPKKNVPACQMSSTSTFSWWNCEIPAYRKGNLPFFFGCALQTDLRRRHPPKPLLVPALHAPQPLSGTGGQPTPSLKAEHSGEHNQELRQTSHTACRSQSSLLLTKIEREAKRSPEYTNERRWMINGESSGSKSATISANRRFGGKAECKPCHLSVLCKWHTCKTLPLQKLSDY